MYIDLSTAPELARIVKAAGVRGKSRTIQVRKFTGPYGMNSYWDGGTRKEFALVDIATMQTWRVPTTHPHFDQLPNGERCGNLELRELPPNACLVSGGTFLGKPAQITLHFRSENLAGLLPAPPAPLSGPAQSALRIVSSIRSNYRDDEFQRSGLGRYSADNPAIAELAGAGLVKINKAGAVAITTDGRNAVTRICGKQDHDHSHLHLHHPR